MTLQRVTHIEGLDAHYEDKELLDDTPPQGVICKFEVRSEEIPAESTDSIVRKNFVYVTRTWEVGHSSYSRRIRDKVTFDTASGKWKILKLAEGNQSDIKRNTEEWNAFVRGATEDDLGTPIAMLFKNDPSRALFYKDKYIKTIERLAGVNHTDAGLLGFGVTDDVKKAQTYLARMSANVGAASTVSRLDDMQQENAVLRAQLEDLKSKLTSEEIPQKRGRGRPPKVSAEDSAFAVE